MDAEQVVEKILADAKAEADKLKQQTDKKEAAEQEQFARQLKEYNAKTEILAREAAEEEKAHILATARMEIAKEYLAGKRSILDEVLAQAEKQLQNLPEKDYRDIIARLMLGIIETGDEEVIVGRQDKRIDHDFIKDINRQLGPDFKGNLRLSEDKQDISGGFILKRGKIKNNASFEVLLDRASKELEIELAQELFS